LNDGDGAALAKGFERDMARRLVGLDISEALRSLRAEGYECETGEAHELHPDPKSFCRRGFATQACQTDREATLATKRSVVRSVDTAFVRDCVGLDRDWPTPKRSPIDDQLAPLK
jgi:hypothetical protein